MRIETSSGSLWIPIDTAMQLNESFATYQQDMMAQHAQTSQQYAQHNSPEGQQ